MKKEFADKEDNNELNALTVNMDIYIYPSETSLRLSVHNAKGNSYDIGFQKIKATDIGKMYQQLEIIAGSINPEVKELIGNPMGGDICENSR
ncbi:MAG: hypothetical protein RBR14_06415 [Candidatus Cloacimonas acidaminovorans]|nr:hypothetical protein [Candidatus Cloacimonas acidaminovorans]